MENRHLPGWTWMDYSGLRVGGTIRGYDPYIPYIN